jgi:hypothetical protein
MSLVNELNNAILKQGEKIKKNTNSIQEKENTIQ